MIAGERSDEASVGWSEARPAGTADGARATSTGMLAAAPRSALAEDLSTIGVLVRRDVTRFVREKSRVAGALLQPLIFWLVIGSGMSGTFRLPGDPAGCTLLQLRCRLLQHLFAPAADANARAQLQEALAHRQAKASASAGDQDSLVRQRLHASHRLV